MVLIPNREDVTENGELKMGVVATEYDLYPQLLTDLKDIDYNNLRNIKPGQIGLLAYVPNGAKRFSFVLMQDPRFTSNEQ